MDHWELIDTATIPNDGGKLQLYRHIDEFVIRIPGHGELMNSRSHGSEDALGAFTCQRLGDVKDARVLIGGLGMGFTLAAALDCLAADATVAVAELVPGVVRWNEDVLGGCAGHPLRDERVNLIEADVGKLIRRASDEFDAIVLDVDNGPEGLTHPENERLYSLMGLADAYQALRPNGMLAIWSAGPKHVFREGLNKIGFSVDERQVRAHGGKGARHVIWLATRE